MADRESGSGGGFLTGLLVGGALGAVIALLYAPQKGDETRDLLKQKTDTYSDLAKTKASEISSKASELSEVAKSKASEISEKVGGVADTVKSRSAEVADSVSSKAGQMSDTVMSTASGLASKASDVISTVHDTASSSIEAGKKAAADKKRELNAENGEDTGGVATAETS